MTIKDILRTGASMIGRDDVVEYIDGSAQNVGEQTMPTINLMVNLINLVISELSATFIPMINSETVNVENGKIYYAKLKENAIKIIDVYDIDGKELSAKYTAEYIVVSGDKAIVEYEYAPSNYGLTDTIGYSAKDVSLSTLAYGLIAEYSISQGCFDEAVMWHKRYVESVMAMRKVKNVTVKGRCFV